MSLHPGSASNTRSLNNFHYIDCFEKWHQDHCVVVQQGSS